MRVTKAGAIRLQLLRSSAGSFVTKLLSTALAFTVGVVLARVLGPESFGIYAYVFAIASVLAIPAEFGLSHLVVRETAKADAYETWGLMRGIWKWTNTATGVLSIVVAILSSSAVLLFGKDWDAIYVHTFFWSLAFIPLVSLGKLRGAALRGLNYAVRGQLPESIIRPTVLLALVGGWIYLGPAGLGADNAMMLHVLAAVCAFAVGAWMLRRAKPSELSSAIRPVYSSQEWIRATLPLALLAGMQFIHKYTDILMLGMFRPAEDVGVYQIVEQGATLVVFGQQASNMVLAPQFARLYSQGDARTLWATVRLGTLIGIVTGLPVALVFVTLGEDVLRIIFGPDYSIGHTALAILALGQLVNAALGQVAHLLNMTGHERHTSRGFFISAITNVILNFLFIPWLGMAGAALATSISLVVWNVLLWRVAYNPVIFTLQAGAGMWRKVK